MPASIHGQERSIEKVFSDDYSFVVPLYQRPYSWLEENARELLDDLLESIGNAESVTELDPYFLGSIVLIKPDAPTSEIIDGQQRLTTLTILLAALRHTMADRETAAYLTRYIYEKGNPLTDRPDRFRLTLRAQDAEFFQTYIQKEGGIERLVAHKQPLPDTQQRIRGNALVYVDALRKLAEPNRHQLARFIINRCFLVVVSTPSFDAAYRIFSILNDRGMNLTQSDILKAELIGKLAEQDRQLYAQQWEALEEELTGERFNQLFTHVRMIYRKTKLRNLLAEFREYIIKQAIPSTDHNKRANETKLFLEDKLFPYARVFKQIITSSYFSTTNPSPINDVFRWLMMIDNADWVAPALAYLHARAGEDEDLLRFFTHLERLAASFLVRRTNVNRRIERYAQLLTAIEDKQNLYGASSPLQLTPEEMRDMLAELDGNVYEMNARARNYVLLRLDRALSADPSYAARDLNPTVEHVLPQRPASTSRWSTLFTPAERERLTGKLGNLVLLTRNKNSQAQNYDFPDKKAKYFSEVKGITNYAIAVSVLAHNADWTPEVIASRQRSLLQTVCRVWQIDEQLLSTITTNARP